MPTIKKIIETTERTVENLITKEGEFQFLNGGFVREGVPYHIHNTINKKEYYMTGPEHHPLLSKLMIRRKNDSIFSQYINVFPAKREKYLDAHSFDLTEGDLEMSNKVDIQKLISRDDMYGRYAWSVISKIINYAASLIPSVTERHNNIDEAMRLGFNWTIGPFEMLKEINVKNFVLKDQQLKQSKFINDLYLKGILNWYGDPQLYINDSYETLRNASLFN